MKKKTHTIDESAGQKNGNNEISLFQTYLDKCVSHGVDWIIHDDAKHQIFKCWSLT